MDSKKSYAQIYFELIRDSLANTVVTDKEGSGFTLDEGLNIWADKAYHIKQNTKGLLFFCGNGASSSMAEHMSHDWFQNGVVNTETCSEISHITAISNDCGYEEVYRYRVKRILSERDMLIGISSSGNSQNIINAVEAANQNGAFTITLSGMQEGNSLSRIGDLNFYVPLNHYGEVESAHAVLLHCALDYYMDKYLGGRH